MELVYPNIKYKDSYIDAVKEYQDENQGHGRYLELNLEKLKTDFESYVEKLKSESNGENLKSGYVQHTEFWLVDEDKYIGRVDIRHVLNDHLLKVGGHIGYDIRKSERNKGYGTQALKMALPFAKNLGLEKVLITCDSTNIGSRKIIESNGGIFENEIPGENGEPSKLRFWIDLK